MSKDEPQEVRALEIPELVSDLTHINQNLEDLISELGDRLSSILSSPQPKNDDEENAVSEKRTELGRSLYNIKTKLHKNFECLYDLKGRLEV